MDSLNEDGEDGRPCGGGGARPSPAILNKRKLSVLFVRGGEWGVL